MSNHTHMLNNHRGSSRIETVLQQKNRCETIGLELTGTVELASTIVHSTGPT